MHHYVIGLDYGSDSVRAVLLDAHSGAEMASHVHAYARWKEGRFCNPSISQFRQHPLDHIEGLEATIRGVLSRAKVDPATIKGICVDTTGSSPLPVTAAGIPLALLPEFADNPQAMMVLWKDHTAIAEAEEINALAGSWGGEDYTRYEGGIYSSEWFWAKILHVIRQDAKVKAQAWSWVEHCDLMTHLLTGSQDLTQLKRSRCAAGHKAMWHPSWGGLPPKAFLGQLDPYLADLRDRLYTDTYTSDVPAGNLSAEWAERLSLTTDTVVAVGTFDAHAGAVGAGIEAYTLVRVMGTSTCDIMVSPPEVVGDKTVPGICGQVDGSVLPQMVGLEAGQSAFGDVLGWFKSVLLAPLQQLVQQSDVLSPSQKAALLKEADQNLIPLLSAEAERIPLAESLPTALDWINGRRTPDANQALKAAISNLSLGTQAAHLFKALVHAICFGSKKILDRFEEEGVEIRQVIGIGGVARKSPYVMQTLANVLNRPIVVAESDYAPALGAAIYAAVAAGLYPDVVQASQCLKSPPEATYHPQAEAVSLMGTLMEGYDRLADFVESITEN
ncbi:MAG: ribulokinase [Bacteroidetes bacterium]|nr:MAG: ribulokinase [Bacteroidota bacterium]